MNNEPKSLQEAIIYFSNPDNCIAHLVAQRWPDGIVKCPTCGNEKVNYVPIGALGLAPAITPSVSSPSRLEP